MQTPEMRRKILEYLGVWDNPEALDQELNIEELTKETLEDYPQELSAEEKMLLEESEAKQEDIPLVQDKPSPKKPN